MPKFWGVKIFSQIWFFNLTEDLTYGNNMYKNKRNHGVYNLAKVKILILKKNCLHIFGIYVVVKFVNNTQKQESRWNIFNISKDLFWVKRKYNKASNIFLQLMEAAQWVEPDGMSK